MIKIKSPVTWIGNKTSILHILYALFPIGCDRYVEPFGGSGAVLLGKPVPDKFEVFNDYNRNLVNLFRCMRDRPMEFIRELGFLSLNSRDDFAVLKKFFEKEEFTEDYLKAQLDLTEILLPEVTAKEVRTLYSAARNDHDLRRAAMFLKLIRYSYSSGCKSFACQPFSLRTLFALVQDFAMRCENVVIENQDFEILIKHYDRPTTFTYCDPPYFTSEYVYDCGFTWEDHLRLYHALAGMKGKGNREVKYADKKEIQDGILEKYPPEWKEETPAPSDADGGGQAQQDSPKNEPQRTQPKDKDRGGNPIRTSPPKKETAPDMTEAEIIKDLTETEVQSNEPS